LIVDDDGGLADVIIVTKLLEIGEPEAAAAASGNAPQSWSSRLLVPTWLLPVVIGAMVVLV
jgi:hypothetical protein